MSVLFTSIVRVKDWQALQTLSDTTLLEQARQAGVTRYRVYRNQHDASQALLIFELPSHDALEWLSSEGLNQQLGTLGEGDDDWVWELAGFETIG